MGKLLSVSTSASRCIRILSPTEDMGSLNGTGGKTESLFSPEMIQKLVGV